MTRSLQVRLRVDPHHSNFCLLMGRSAETPEIVFINLPLAATRSL
jgi:hypothetical protein